MIMFYFCSKQDRVILRPFAFIQVNAKESAINCMGTVSNTNICYLDIDFTFIQQLYFIFHGLTTLASLDLFIVEVSTWQSFGKTQSVGLFWTGVRSSQRSP